MINYSYDHLLYEYNMDKFTYKNILFTVIKNTECEWIYYRYEIIIIILIHEYEYLNI